VIVPAVLAIITLAEVGRAQSQAAATRAVNFRTTRADAALEALAVTETGDERWWPICYGPCRVALPPGLVLRVAGPQLMTSSRFSVQPGEATLEVNTRPGLAALWTTGAIFTAAGSTAVAFGLVKYELADICSLDADPPDPHCADQGRSTAAVVMVAGAAALTAGVLMIVLNDTKVDFSPTGQEPAMRLTKGFSLTPRGLVF
jgi:hypothetical protein